MQGKLNAATWMTKLSLSSNEGTYNQPFPGQIYQFSGIVSLEKPVKWLGGSNIRAAVSVDQGKLFDNALGMMLAIRKDFAF